jgi:hypothetical protein
LSQQDNTPLAVVALIVVILFGALIVSSPTEKQVKRLTLPNAIWLETSRITELLTDPDQLLDYLEDGEITLINLFIGRWTTAHVINYNYSDAQLTTLIDTIHGGNPDFKAMAWVPATHPPDPLVDISTGANRTLMINEAVACVNKGFDGFNDDVEEFTGSLANLASLENDMATAIHALSGSKLHTCALMSHPSYDIETLYPLVTNPDYILAMLYSATAWGESKFKTAMDRVLDNTGTSLLIGMPVHDANYTIPLTNYFLWIDEQKEDGGPYLNLKGYAIYDGYLEGMQLDDWTAWTIWITAGEPPAPPVSADIEVDVNPSTTVVSNPLALGFGLAFGQTGNFVDKSSYQSLAKNAKFGYARIFDFHFGYSGGYNHPCTAWNEGAGTGTFTWTNVDLLVNALINLGIEPIICFGFVDSDGFVDACVPTGMALDGVTGLPAPATYAKYLEYWVNHFASEGLNVEYYEIINEPWLYHGTNDVKMGYYQAVYDAVQPAIKAIDATLLVGINGDSREYVVDYWIANAGADMDFMALHKYDSGTVGAYTDAQMFSRAETRKLESDGFWYSPADVKSLIEAYQGSAIEILDTESNFNSTTGSGSDPDIQTMTGAVWLALKLRAELLAGLDLAVYWRFAESQAFARDKPTGGWGLCMVNADNNLPYYPYFVQWMLGQRLSVGDTILSSSSSSDDLRALAWRHTDDDTLSVLLIHLSTEEETVVVSGVPGDATLTFVDNEVQQSYQTTTVTAGDMITLSGYTVALLHSPGIVAPEPPVPPPPQTDPPGPSEPPPPIPPPPQEEPPETPEAPPPPPLPIELPDPLSPRGKRFSQLLLTLSKHEPKGLNQIIAVLNKQKPLTFQEILWVLNKVGEV